MVWWYSMVNYAFIDSNNIIVNVVGFDTTPSDEIMNHFIEIQAEVNKCIIKQVVVITDKDRGCGVGAIFQGGVLKPEKPYPSWVWNELNWIWIPPKLHPHALNNQDGHEYSWSEDSRVWILVS